MTDFELIVLVFGILLLNIGWWELFYELNIKEWKEDSE